MYAQNEWGRLKSHMSLRINKRNIAGHGTIKLILEHDIILFRIRVKFKGSVLYGALKHQGLCTTKKVLVEKGNPINVLVAMKRLRNRYIFYILENRLFLYCCLQAFAFCPLNGMYILVYVNSK